MYNPAQAGTAHSIYSDSEQLLQPGSEEPAHPAAVKLLLLMLPDRLILDITLLQNWHSCIYCIVGDSCFSFVTASL